MEGTRTKTIGRISFPGRAGQTAGAGLGLRDLGSRLRVGMRPAHNTDSDEIALHLGRKFNPRLLLGALAAGAAVLGSLDLLQSHGFGYSLRLFDLSDSDIRSELGFSATLTSALLVLAAWLCFALSDVDPRRSRAHWGVAGTVFAVFAVLELFGFQQWVEAHLDPSRAAYLPLVAGAALAWIGSLYTLRTRQWLQALFGLAMVGWLGAWLVDGAQAAGAADPALAELAEFIAAGLFCVALLGRLHYISQRLDPLEQVEAPEISRVVAHLVSRANLERAIWVLGGLIAFFALEDILLHTGNYHGHQIPVLDVNTEQTIPATFSALLLIVAGGLAFLASEMRGMLRADRPWWKWLGIVFVALAFEEVAAIHDTFQDVTGLPGQIILLPLAVVGIVVWRQVVRRTADRPAVHALLIAGAAAWLVSQASDVLLNPIMRWTIVPEEAMEMIGSTLWLLAAMVLVRELLPQARRGAEAAEQGLEPRFPGSEPAISRSARTDSAL